VERAPEPPREGPSRVQMMNFTVYQLLISLVNLLNLPLPDGTYVPRRSARLTVFEKHVRHLRLLKDALATDDPAALRAYLLPIKSLAFEVEFLLEQEPDLARNPDFFDGFRRLQTLLHNAEETADFAECADLAYRLSILLPFYEDPLYLEARRRQADEYDRMLSRRQGRRGGQGPPPDRSS